MADTTPPPFICRHGSSSMPLACGRLPWRQQDFLARFRGGAAAGLARRRLGWVERTTRTNRQYAFAFAFRRSTHWLVIWPDDDEWGVVDGESFVWGWIPSNEAAREALQTFVERTGIRGPR